jgi:hypothetical protein
LDFKKLGPYKIIARKSPVNYKLRLPKGLRLYLVFYVSLLEKALDSVRLSNKEISLEEDLDVYDIERILSSRVSNKKIEYLVKWLDYDNIHNT